MENLDATIIATAAPAIGADLHVTPVDVNLAMTAYLITIAAGIPISGWLTDRFGGRRVFTTAIAIFTVASLLCALSISFPMLVGSRVLQGAGGALMVPVGRLVVLRVTAKRDLLDAVAYLTWPALLAPVIAPAAGGWIITVASWHWIFLINIPLGILAFVAAVRLVPSAEPTPVRPLDWMGFVLCAGTLVALISTLELLNGRGSSRFEVVIGVVAIAGFGTAGALWFRRAAHPLITFDALRNQAFRVSNVSGGVYRMVISAVPFLLPLMFQIGYGWTPIRAGLLVLWLFAGNVAIKPATSPLLRRFGFRRVLITSVLAGSVMFVAIAFCSPATPLPLIGAVLVLSGALRSVGFSAYNSLQFAEIAGPAMSAANTLASTIQQVAVGLGVAVGAVILRSAKSFAPAGSALTFPYTIAFAVLAVLMAYPLVDAVRLHRSAGSELVRRD
jgi:EmrB/QacA subfamily drug resistance transporter